MTRKIPEIVEAAARALCAADGHDPEALLVATELPRTRDQRLYAPKPENVSPAWHYQLDRDRRREPGMNGVSRPLELTPAPPPGARHVIFATPALTHWVSLEHHDSMIRTEWLMAKADISTGHVQQGGDPYLSKVRSKLATDFLRDHPTATDLFFIDDDVGWPAEKVLEFLERPEDILAGVYPKKSEKLDFPVELMFDTDKGELEERDGLVRAIGVPTGFLRIRRHVIEKMALASKEFMEPDVHGVQRTYKAIFEMGIAEDGRWWGEDYAWSRRATSMGFEIWVDPGITFSHRGTRAWVNSLGNYMGQYRDKAASLKATGTAQAENTIDIAATVP